MNYDSKKPIIYASRTAVNSCICPVPQPKFSDMINGHFCLLFVCPLHKIKWIIAKVTIINLLLKKKKTKNKNNSIKSINLFQISLHQYNLIIYCIIIFFFCFFFLQPTEVNRLCEGLHVEYMYYKYTSYYIENIYV